MHLKKQNSSIIYHFFEILDSSTSFFRFSWESIEGNKEKESTSKEVLGFLDRNGVR